jgi:SagB-type dehydrogenase family enzyme
MIETVRGYRVNPALVVTFDGDGATFTDATTRREFTSPSCAPVAMLAAFADATGALLEHFKSLFSEATLEAAFEELVRAGALVAAEEAATLPARWEDWGPAAWFMHLQTTDVEYAVGTTEQMEATREVTEAMPSPDPFKCLCRDLESIRLPRPRALPEKLTATMARRRTCRRYGQEPVALEALSDVLFHSAGYLFLEEIEHFGDVVKKFAPSPGARHSLELYPVVAACEGLRPGIYHYCARDHALNLLGEHDAFALSRRALVDQDYFADAAVTFYMTCVVERLMWKYKSPRVYRLAHIEAGHYCQNLVLAGTALGLGVFQTGAVAERVLNPVLGIDGEREFVIYAAGLGVEGGEPTYLSRDIRMSPHLPPGTDVRLPDV